MAVDFTTFRKGGLYRLNRGFSMPELKRLKYAAKSSLMGSILPGVGFELTDSQKLPAPYFELTSKGGPPARLLLTPDEFVFYFTKSELYVPVIRKAVSMLSMSDKGVNFLYGIEAQKGVSNKLHWPKGESGVTLGPGYDMKLRSKDDVKTAMTALGLSEAVAKSVAEGAGKSGAEADKFAKDNSTLVDLSETQEKTLMRKILPHYEKLARKYITVVLAQHEFDALVSFCYNPAKSIASVMTAINQGKLAAAMEDIKSRVPSDGPNRKGLINRRAKEVDLFMNAKY